jgi:hypothetical protein
MQEESSVDLEEFKEDNDHGAIITEQFQKSQSTCQILESNLIILDASDDECKDKTTEGNYICKKRKKIVKEKKFRNKVLSFFICKKRPRFQNDFLCL